MTGSDLHESDATRRFVRSAPASFIGHQEENLAAAPVVVISTGGQILES